MAPDAPLPPEAGIPPELLRKQREAREQKRAESAQEEPGDPASGAMMHARYDAQEKVLLCVREAFGMPPLDPTTGKGATEAMCLAVLGAFLDFLMGEPKPAGKTATS